MILAASSFGPMRSKEKRWLLAKAWCCHVLWGCRPTSPRLEAALRAKKETSQGNSIRRTAWTSVPFRLRIRFTLSSTRSLPLSQRPSIKLLTDAHGIPASSTRIARHSSRLPSSRRLNLLSLKILMTFFSRRRVEQGEIQRFSAPWVERRYFLSIVCLVLKKFLLFRENFFKEQWSTPIGCKLISTLVSLRSLNHHRWK